MVYQAVHSCRIARITCLRYQNFEFVDAGTEDADLLGAFWLHCWEAGGIMQVFDGARSNPPRISNGKLIKSRSSDGGMR